MKRYWTLAILALVVLAGAAVWLGGLNQDEGWYLYAANLVAGGEVPYRDFAYTQGPMMPKVYSAFTWVWDNWGLLGARVFTLLLGLLSIVYFAATAAKLAAAGENGKSPVSPAAALTVVFLLGCNLYHLYYTAIPKTYALASLFVAIGFWLLVCGSTRQNASRLSFGASFLFCGLSLACAAGTRISLGAILCVVGGWFLFRGEWRKLVWFCVGGFSGLALVYGPYLLDHGAFKGLVAAQQYHAARGGFDPVFTVGSLSRLVRWYLPIFIVLGLGIAKLIAAKGTEGTQGTEGTKRALAIHWLLLFAFLAVFAVQMLAPFPYEDYQVPVMGLLAVFATVAFLGKPASPTPTPTLTPTPTPIFHTYSPLLVFGLAYACAFGSPLLEKWTTNGQDRFWSLKKAKSELAQLRDVAKKIEAIDPDGTTLMTQDLYLAIETGRRVPRGLEMGPFAILTDAEWRTLLSTATPKVAALSGYSFAIKPPVCNERSIDEQLAYWKILRDRYDFVAREEAFGQNATPLLILKRK